ncbi:hypothetical protein ABIA38_001346, partial [Embleya sp. AB8]
DGHVVDGQQRMRSTKQRPRPRRGRATTRRRPPATTRPRRTDPGPPRQQPNTTTPSGQPHPTANQRSRPGQQRPRSGRATTDAKHQASKTPAPEGTCNDDTAATTTTPPRRTDPERPPSGRATTTLRQPSPDRPNHRPPSGRAISRGAAPVDEVCGRAALVVLGDRVREGHVPHHACALGRRELVPLSGRNDGFLHGGPGFAGSTADDLPRVLGPLGARVREREEGSGRFRFRF